MTPLPDGSVVSFNGDDTLFTIHSEPTEVDIHPAVPGLLDELATRHTVLVISGRTATQISQIVAARRIGYVGLNGLQRLEPGGDVWTHPTALERGPDLGRIAREVLNWPDVKTLHVSVELRESVMMSVHWRDVPVDDVVAAERVGHRIAARAEEEGYLYVRTDRGLDVVPYGNDPGGALITLATRTNAPLTAHVGDGPSDATVHDQIRQLVGDGTLPRGVVVGVRSANTPPEILRCGTDEPDGVEGLLVDGPEGVRELLQQLV